jgi:NADH dehydrogenase [ubiquinone] 1 alpha subcomplex assembly factor 5
LSPQPARRTSAAVSRDLFNRHLRKLRRDRAARSGPDLFLVERAFEDCLDRLRDIPRSYNRALLVGCPSPRWPERPKALAAEVEVCDPGGLFAAQAGGEQVEEDRHDFGEERFDLCVAIGTLDTVNDLPLALQLLGRSLRPDSPLIGAIAGGNSLSALRASLIEAGRAKGQVIARTHPRIEPASLARLLGAAGFNMPVVDVDRVRLRYKDLGTLISDLRAMAATSVLAERPPPLSRDGAKLANAAFSALATDGRTEEILEILHFIAWTK